MYSANVEGPLDLGAMMVAFVEVRDESGTLCNPDGVRVRVLVENSDWGGVFLTPGDKGVGRCEYAPVMADGRVYTMFLVDAGGAIVSGVARLDTGLPIGDKAKEPEGFIHKSFRVTFQENGASPPPPPGPDPDERIAQLEAALENQRARWVDAAQHAEAAIVAIDATLDV